MHLDGIDLNLLPPLVALLEERHITRAAERSGLSQPAMSRTLARLRQLLDDQLLVRHGSGYVLTPRAERIQRKLADVVPALELLFRTEAYDPVIADEHYRLAASDYALVLFLNEVGRIVSRLSPHSVLRIETPRTEVFDDILHAKLDLTFFFGAPPAPLCQERLLDDTLICVMSNEHPLASHKRLTLEEYLGCYHVVIDVIDGEQPLIANTLRQLGLARRASLTVPQHALVPAIIPDTHLVATMPARLIDTFASMPRVTVVPAPAELEEFHLFMVWHPRLDQDPAHEWLRELIRSVVSGI